jgi:hypothetical protein
LEGLNPTASYPLFSHFLSLLRVSGSLDSRDSKDFVITPGNTKLCKQILSWSLTHVIQTTLFCSSAWIYRFCCVALSSLWRGITVPWNIWLRTVNLRLYLIHNEVSKFSVVCMQKCYPYCLVLSLIGLLWIHALLHFKILAPPLFQWASFHYFNMSLSHCFLPPLCQYY